MQLGTVISQSGAVGYRHTPVWCSRVPSYPSLVQLGTVIPQSGAVGYRDPPVWCSWYRDLKGTDRIVSLGLLTSVPDRLAGRQVFFFFFLCLPSFISGLRHFGVRFYLCDCFKSSFIGSHKPSVFVDGTCWVCFCCWHSLV